MYVSLALFTLPVPVTVSLRRQLQPRTGQSSINVSQLQRHPLRDYYYYYGVSVRVYVCDPLVVAVVLVVVVAVACVSLCTADPSAVATRPDVNGTNQPHITRSWCATIIAYTWTDSCRDFTRSRVPAAFVLSTHHCPGRKIAGEKKKGFSPVYLFLRLF